MISFEQYLASSSESIQKISKGDKSSVISKVSSEIQTMSEEDHINTLNDNIKLNYEFSVNHDLNEIQYNSLSTTIKKNNFVTTFNYIEEEGEVGSANIFENVTTFNINQENFVTFKTRENKEIDLTEYSLQE